MSNATVMLATPPGVAFILTKRMSTRVRVSKKGRCYRLYSMVMMMVKALVVGSHGNTAGGNGDGAYGMGPA